MDLVVERLDAVEWAGMFWISTEIEVLDSSTADRFYSGISIRQTKQLFWPAYRCALCS
jgi:hypothetical protein